MKTKVALVVLILVCAGLGIALVSRNKQATETHQKDVDVILYHSNQWVETTAKLEEQKQVNLNLEKDITARKTDISALSNNLTQTAESLSKTEAALKTALEENAKRDARISELEQQKETLDKQAVDLKSSIGSLETQIAETQKKLTASEGDKAFLEKELKRLVAEKAELERQFNDLAVLRAQVHKLKEELSIARRLEWIRQGLFASQDQKGAQKLMQGASAASPRVPTYTNKYDLNIEVNSDGSVSVIQPVTNAAPPAPKPAQQ
jgi:chromosome segregation ATPase